MQENGFFENEYPDPAESYAFSPEVSGAGSEVSGVSSEYTGGSEEFRSDAGEYFAHGGREPFAVPAADAEENAENARRKRRTAKQLLQKTGYLVASCVAVVMLATAVPDFASDFKWGSGSTQDAYYSDTVSAIVCDAVDRSPVSAQMTFSDASGREVAHTRSDRDGAYNVTLPEGEYTVTLTASGYVDDSLTFYQPYDGPVDQVFAMSAELRRGQMRIVLQWGENPTDLDSHLFGTSRENAGMHVFYSDMYGYGGSYDSSGNRKLYAMLDVDDTSSYGPETVTIYDLNANYIYAVYDYSSGGSLSSSQLASSSAVIKVYTYGSRTPETFTLPRGEGTWWHVFRIQNGSVRPIQSLSTLSPANESDLYSGN